MPNQASNKLRVLAGRYRVPQGHWKYNFRVLVKKTGRIGKIHHTETVMRRRNHNLLFTNVNFGEGKPI